MDSIGIESTLGTDSAFLLSPLENMSKSSYISFIPANFDDWHPYFKKNNIDEKFNSKVLPIISKIIKKNNLKIKILPHFNLESEYKYCNYMKKYKKE